MTPEPTLSSSDVCRMTGMTYRQLHYMTAQGIVTPTVPSTGSGSQMRFTYGQIRVLLVAARLRALGATEQALGRAVASIEALPEYVWWRRVVVTSEGDLGELDAFGEGYLLDLARYSESILTAA